MAGVRVLKKPGEKRERAAEKRRRIEGNREARHLAKRIVIPLLVVIIAILASFFFYKYGLGGGSSGTGVGRSSKLDLEKAMKAIKDLESMAAAVKATQEVKVD